MSITAAKPAITGKYLCHDRLPSHAATNSPELKLHSSALATAASARARPDQKPFPCDHAQRPRRDSATASGSTIPDASVMTLVGSKLANSAAAIPTCVPQ